MKAYLIVAFFQLSTLKVHFAATTLNNFSSFETEKPELSEQING
jgi:hypothetical protein